MPERSRGKHLQKRSNLGAICDKIGTFHTISEEPCHECQAFVTGSLGAIKTLIAGLPFILQGQN